MKEREINGKRGREKLMEEDRWKRVAEVEGGEEKWKERGRN